MAVNEPATTYPPSRVKSNEPVVLMPGLMEVIVMLPLFAW
jgi:hypothetical protein